MKILFLGYDKSETSLIEQLVALGHEVEQTANKIINGLSGFDLVISFGYKHLLNAEILHSASRPVLNIHISYLPYNRGAHPNFWFWVERSPSGVTIHEMDVGLDTGPIVFQRRVGHLNVNMTFVESYQILLAEAEALFMQNIDAIFRGTYQKLPQNGVGSEHKAKELPTWLQWDMKIKDAIDIYDRSRENGAGTSV